MRKLHGMEIVITGGRVIDPANGIDQLGDVVVSNGRIAQVGANASDAAETVIDASGLIVAPGLLDIHFHAYYTRENADAGGCYRPGTSISLMPDCHSFRSGVTTVVDAGSAGADNFEHFKRTVIDESKVRVLAFVNIVKSGMLGPWEQDVREMVPELAASMASAHPDVCVGIKTAHYWTHKPYDADHPPWAAVDGAIAAAEICGLPVMYDFWHRPDRTYRDLLLEKARPGDIHTHMYAQQFPIVDSSGGPEGYLFEAREKGIHFDLGHGAGSFWFRQAAPCIDGGHAPDSISTDLHTMNHAGPVHCQLTCMSKLMNMGLSVEQVIEKSTSAAARAIRRPELGTLSVGSDADVALLRVVHGPCAFVDCGKAKLTGNRQLECLLTIRAGEVVYNPLGMGLPEWPDAPARYWEIRPVNAQQAANP